ncbi:MAG: hypothetical protein H0V23_08775 [Nocardioidaceae bacterium]|nr:hypothetical protein [Nocardioidaceae bacterium]
MKKVYLHIGAPKTGTTQLQDLLYLNRDKLRAGGVLYPAERFDQHFLAALDLLGKKWGGLEKQAVGVWDTLVAQANDWDGTVVISHEILAAASPRQVSRALSAIEGEVHVIYSVRDLARQIPAEWQEGVKHRRKMSYVEFLDDLSSDEPQTAVLQWFWSVQHWPQVLDRWGSTLPPEQVHVVTVPPPGASRSLLLNRFLRVLEIDRQWLTVPSERANPSLGGAETTVIRNLNLRLTSRRLKGPHYRHFVREVLVHQTLADRPGTEKITIPPSLYDWVASTTRDWIASLQSRGYTIVGDLAELEPSRPSVDWYDPDEASDAEQLAVAYRIIEALLLELAAREPAAGAGPRPVTRREKVKRAAIRLAGPRIAGAGLRVYRRVPRRLGR